MLKEKKLNYQEELEEYLEENNVYELFEDMMKSLVMTTPDDPLKFLINKLTQPESKLQF